MAKDRLHLLTSQLLRSFPRGRDHDDTTGIFNEAYLRLHSSLDEVKPSTVRQFLGLAALEIRRTLLDVVRKVSGRGKTKKGTRVGGNVGGGGDEEGAIIDPPIKGDDQKRFELTEDLFTAIDELPPELKEVVMLLHFQGLTQAEVAALFEVHEDTVKRWWAKARILLAERLAAFEPVS